MNGDEFYNVDPADHGLDPILQNDGTTTGTEKPEVKNEPAPISQKEFRQQQKELEQTRARVREAEETARYWSERAQSTATPAPKAPDAPAEDLLEIISSGDNSKLEGALKRMGFVKNDEVESRISTVRASAQAEAVLQRDFPGIADENHPMFKATAKAYQQLIREEPALRNNPRATVIAARLAAAELREQGIDPRAVDFTEEDDEDDNSTPIMRKVTTGGRETESDRVRRVSAQGTGRTTKPARNRETNDALDNTQRDVIAKFRAAGADSLTEDSYRKRAQAGVKMGGIPQGRRS